MSHGEQGISSIWPTGSALIGVVHLPPLPGAPGWRGSMEEVSTRARDDAGALTAAGFDGVIVENFSDAPFFGAAVPPETVAAMTAAALAAREATPLPLGVNVLRNDPAAALAIAAAVGADFIRVNVHTGSMWTDQGWIEGRAAETMRSRALLAPRVALLADVHVKHAVPPPGSRIEDAARDTWHRGLADALIVSGSATGTAPTRTELESVRASVPDAPLLVGSGLTGQNGPALLEVADGAIVGSSIMEGGRAGAAIDPDRARELIAALRTSG